MPPSGGYEVGEILMRAASSFIQQKFIGYLLCDDIVLDAKETVGSKTNREQSPSGSSSSRV